MMAEKAHTSMGLAALICGILGIVIIFIPFISFGSFILAIIAIVLGYLARKEGDRYGIIGIILGALVILLAVIFIVIAGMLYMYVTNMMPPGP